MCDCSSDFSTYMRHRDQVDQHLFDPDPERTLHITHREHNRNLADMEKNEEQNLDIERNEPQRGRNGNNGRNQAPRPFFSQMIHSCC